MSTYWVVLIAVVLVAGMVIGAYVRGWLLLPSDRRRLRFLADRLMAEQQIEALTRDTIQKMRDVTRRRAAGS